MAILSNGFRLLPEFGNAGQRTQYKIKNIAPGVYYWSVQAVDNSELDLSFETWVEPWYHR